MFRAKEFPAQVGPYCKRRKARTENECINVVATAELLELLMLRILNTGKAYHVDVENQNLTKGGSRLKRKTT